MVDRERALHRFLSFGYRPSETRFGGNSSATNHRCWCPLAVLQNKWVHNFTTIHTVKRNNRDDTPFIFKIHTGFPDHEPMTAETKHKRFLSPSPHVGDLPIIQLAGPTTLLNYLGIDQLTVKCFSSWSSICDRT
jgi:hypothetical protein